MVDFVQQVDVHAGMLHDAVLMWGFGVEAQLNKSNSGVQIDHGVEIRKSIVNSNIPGKLLLIGNSLLCQT